MRTYITWDSNRLPQTSRALFLPPHHTIICDSIGYGILLYYFEDDFLGAGELPTATANNFSIYLKKSFNPLKIEKTLQKM